MAASSQNQTSDKTNATNQTPDITCARDPGSDTASNIQDTVDLPRLTSVTDIATNMSAPTPGIRHPIEVAEVQANGGGELVAHPMDVDGQNGQNVSAQQQSSTSPRKSRRGLTKETSMVSVSGDPKEKDDGSDEVSLADTPETTTWAANRKWVIAGIKGNAKRLDQIEDMQLSLAEHVRVGEEESRRDQQTMLRMIQEAQESSNHGSNAGLVNLAKDPIISSLINTSRTLQANVRDANENLRETRVAFNELAALVARCQSRDEAMDTITALQTNVEEIRSLVAQRSLPPLQPVHALETTTTAATTTGPVPPSQPLVLTTPSARTVADGASINGLSGGGPTTPVAVTVPPNPPLSTSPLAISQGAVHHAPPTGTSFNPPLSGSAKGKRPADRPNERGSIKKAKMDSTFIVVTGYTEAVGHPASVAHAIIRTLNLSPLDLISANWKKSSRGFIEMHFRSSQAANAYALTLNSNNTDPNLPELHGLRAEVVEDSPSATAGTYVDNLPGPSNPGPSTR
ncbi:hypothetical protein PM082_006943 [Marasmius tenuissimus]|nr:hypothetical protein PM082_006943 [Marasmius tenuissimus]